MASGLITAMSFCGYLLHYLGAFKSVTVQEEVKGPYVMPYKAHNGPHHKITAVIFKVEELPSRKYI